MIRVLLVDDHALFREGLARLLSGVPELEVAGQCATAEDAIALLANEPYDLILLDYELGDRRGNEVVSYVIDHQLRGKIMVVTVGLTQSEVRQLRNKGVAGIFLKNNSPEMLVEAIHQVLRGEQYFDPKYVDVPLQAPGTSPYRKVRFTERDREVLRGVFDGMGNKEIAEKLRVSESAIKASLQQLFSKTGVRTRSQLVRIALEQYRRELL